MPKKSLSKSAGILDGIGDSLRPGGKDYVKPVPTKSSVKKLTKDRKRLRLLAHKYGMSVKDYTAKLLKERAIIDAADFD